MGDMEALSPASLLTAAAQHDANKCEGLLVEGCDPNVRDEATGDTPLHKVVASGIAHDPIHENARVCTIVCLKQRGAFISALNKRNQTPLHVACSRGLDLSTACLYDGISEASRYEALYNKDDEGDTPLLLATRWNHHLLTQWLLKQGAPVAFTNNQGNSALHYVAKHGHYQLAVEMVSLSPSSSNAVNNAGLTPASMAAQEAAKKARSPPSAMNFYMIYFRLAYPTAKVAVTACDTLSWINQRGACLLIPVIALSTLEQLRNDFYQAQGSLEGLSVLFCVLWISMVILYVFLATCDPGSIVERTLQNSNSYALPRLSFAVKDSQNYRNGYRIMLKHGFKDQKTRFCITCGIERPERSKHDRFTNCCVLRFDHFCPWVNNAVGAFNYPYYLMFITIATFTACIWLIVFAKQLARSPMSTGTILVAVQPLWMAGFGIVLMLQHFRLIARNLTTNEAINFRKYHYLWDEKGKFSNKYDMGSSLNNMCDVVGLLRYWTNTFAGSVLWTTQHYTKLKNKIFNLWNRCPRKGKLAERTITVGENSADSVTIDVGESSGPLQRQTRGSSTQMAGRWI